jgi:hypothetical protein
MSTFCDQLPPDIVCVSPDFMVVITTCFQVLQVPQSQTVVPLSRLHLATALQAMEGERLTCPVMLGDSHCSKSSSHWVYGIYEIRVISGYTDLVMNL